MTQRNFPDRINDDLSKQRSVLDLDCDSNINPVARKFAIGMFISAVLASSGFIIYLFDLIGMNPKFSPTSPPIPPTLQSTSTRVADYLTGK
jgi:hypothetical protein